MNQPRKPGLQSNRHASFEVFNKYILYQLHGSEGIENAGIAELHYAMRLLYFGLQNPRFRKSR
jgi:hypothetical protein